MQVGSTQAVLRCVQERSSALPSPSCRVRCAREEERCALSGEVVRTPDAASVWLRPCERPEWGREDVEWWWKLDERLGLRVPADDELDHKCSTKGCPSEAWLVREQEVGGWGDRRRHVRRRWCCPEHVYGPTMIEDGLVYRAYPRFPEDADVGAGLATRYSDG